jgi:hypothetical protein
MASHSVISAVAAGILVSIAASAQTYSDPRQRFTLVVPDGWTAEPFGQGVKIARGAAYDLVTDASGENPQGLVDGLTRQFGGQWTKFQQLKRGTATVAGQPAPFSFNSGVNPKGVPSFLKVLVVSSEGRTFALIGSAPEKDFLALKAGFDRVEQSFQVKVRTASQPSVQAAPAASQLRAQAMRAASQPSVQAVPSVPRPRAQAEPAVSQSPVQAASVQPEAGTRLGAVEHAPKALVSILGRGFARGGRKTAGGVKSGVNAIRGR